jgi:hypothetical protein
MKAYGFTGSRHWLTKSQQKALVKILGARRPHPEDPDDSRTFHHGDCVGADAWACEHAASTMGFLTVAHPPIKPRWRAFTDSDVILPPKGYLERNDDIVEACEELIACPKREEILQPRSGTWYTIRQARKQGRSIVIIHPSGRIQTEVPNA